MPQRLRFRLAGPSPLSAFQYAKALRAVVLRWVASASPDIATDLHDANQPKPFNVSPLWSEPGPDNHYFEVGVTADWLVPLIVEGSTRGPATLELAHCSYRITAPCSVVSNVGWQDLSDGTPAREWSFRVLTPTCHHAAGTARKAIIAPSPETYLGSWLSRWELCSPIPIPNGIREVVATHVAVARFTGGSEMVTLDNGRPFVGFVGEVTFTVIDAGNVSPSHLIALDSLARFAPYCGTGVETMRGMGQIRLVGAP